MSPLPYRTATVIGSQWLHQESSCGRLKNATAAEAPRKVIRVAQLQAQPLGYEIMRQKGSHRKLEAPNHPVIIFAFHDNQTIRPSTVKDILCNQVGLAERDALALL